MAVSQSAGAQAHAKASSRQHASSVSSAVRIRLQFHPSRPRWLVHWDWGSRALMEAV